MTPEEQLLTDAIRRARQRGRGRMTPEEQLLTDALRRVRWEKRGDIALRFVFRLIVLSADVAVAYLVCRALGILP